MSPTVNNSPVALEDPSRPEGDEHVVARDVDNGLGQQSTFKRATECIDLLFVEGEGAVEALHAEEIPATRAAERADGQRGREALQLVLVGWL